MPSTIRPKTFETSRLLDFCTEKELTNQVGVKKADWPLVVVKELVDNALDACEEAGVPPEITVTLDKDAITVVDNGPGMPEETINGVLDYNIRVSSREAYVAPTIVGFKSTVFTEADLGKAVGTSDTGTLIAYGAGVFNPASTGGAYPRIGRLQRVLDGYAYVQLDSPFVIDVT